jgi:hypothetical protein
MSVRSSTLDYGHFARVVDVSRVESARRAAANGSRAVVSIAGIGGFGVLYLATSSDGSWSSIAFGIVASGITVAALSRLAVELAAGSQLAAVLTALLAVALVAGPEHGVHRNRGQIAVHVQHGPRRLARLHGSGRA